MCAIALGDSAVSSFLYHMVHLLPVIMYLYIHLQVSMKTEVTWVRDMLRGDDVFELQVKLLKQVPEEYPYKDDE